MLGTGWQKTNINDFVCFEKKNDTYGRFTIQKAVGDITVKFAHVSGAVDN